MKCPCIDGLASKPLNSARPHSAGQKRELCPAVHFFIYNTMQFIFVYIELCSQTPSKSTASLQIGARISRWRRDLYFLFVRFPACQVSSRYKSGGFRVVEEQFLTVI